MRTIVTGAASGIGESVAELLLARPEGRVLLVDIDGGRLTALADRLGERAVPLIADLSDPACGAIIVAEAVERLGGIDAIASNAGLLPRGSLLDATPEDFDRAFHINTRATWLLVQAAYPHLRAAGGGSIVVTASMAASDPTPGCGFYAPSKAAVLMVARQLANELGPDNIRVNAVSPGPTLTGMNVTVFADPQARERREATIPLRRLSTPMDIARVIVFLLGEDSHQISGANLPVDGGLTTTLMSAGMVQKN